MIAGPRVLLQSPTSAVLYLAMPSPFLVSQPVEDGLAPISRPLCMLKSLAQGCNLLVRGIGALHRICLPVSMSFMTIDLSRVVPTPRPCK
jgi:hypothetical protein